MQRLDKTHRGGFDWRAAVPGGDAARRGYEPEAGTGRSGIEIRMVSAPGGFAFVEVASGAGDRVSERRGFGSAA